MKKKMTPEQVEKLRERVQRLSYQLSRAEEEVLNETERPALRKLVGRCFCYTNSYGSGDRWPFYCRVIGFDEKRMEFTVIRFQRKSTDKIEIEEHVQFDFGHGSRFGVDSGWKPISLAEYNKAKKQMFQRVEKLFMKSDAVEVEGE